MKSTIQTGEYKDGKSDGKELQRLVNQQRAALNAVSQQGPVRLTTAGTGTLTAIWTSDDMPTLSALSAQVAIIGINAAGTAGAHYSLSALFVRGTGATTQIGSTTIVAYAESAAGFDAAFAVSGNAVQVQVSDDGIETMTWSAMVYVRQVE